VPAVDSAGENALRRARLQVIQQDFSVRERLVERHYELLVAWGYGEVRSASAPRSGQLQRIQSPQDAQHRGAEAGAWGGFAAHDGLRFLGLTLSEEIYSRR